jgi:single-stranded DNA-binding protein
VSGQAGVRTYESQGETRAVLTLNVREVTLLGSKQDGGERPAATASRPAQQQQRPAQQAAKPAAPPADDFGDDEIPFD